MKDSVQRFLTAAERLAIEKRVNSAESVTSGEIVVMAVSQSSHYPSATLAGGGTVAMLLAIAGMFVLHSENLWLFLAIFSLLFMVSHESFKHLPLLKRPFVGRREMVEAVEEASIRSFFNRKVHETRGRTGILIYISLFEQSVRVLADTGIDAKVGKEPWTEIVETISKGVREGRQADAICSAVDRCGELLKLYFPRLPDDLNELGDAMIIGDDGNQPYGR